MISLFLLFMSCTCCPFFVLLQNDLYQIHKNNSCVLQVQNETKIDCIIHHLLHHGIVHKYDVQAQFLLLLYLFVNNKCNFLRFMITSQKSYKMPILSRKIKINIFVYRFISGYNVTQSSYFLKSGCGVVSPPVFTAS